MGSYVETSPSGTGLRGFVYGMTLDDCREKVGNLEVYGKDSVRYVTVTGGVYEEFRPISSNQKSIEAYMIRFGFVKPGTETAKDVAKAAALVGDPAQWPAKSDDEILKLLRRNNKAGKITRLMNGETKDCGGVSESRAALIGHVAFYTRDVGQIVRIVEVSGLLDSKKGQKRTDGKPFAVWDVERVLKGLDGDGSYWVNSAAKAVGVAVAKARAKTLKEKGTANLTGEFAHLLNGRGVFRNTPQVMAEILKMDKRVAGGVFFDLFALMPFRTELFGVAFGVADTVASEPCAVCPIV
jgi:hypothetical protein